MLETAPDIRFMPIYVGGLATTLKEAALESGLCIRIREDAILVRPGQGGVRPIGSYPLYVANEGILVAIVEASKAGQLLTGMRKYPDGRSAAIIGSVEESPAGMVLLDSASVAAWKSSTCFPAKCFHGVC
jgi:hydrogenase expression/formation protein HypE